MADPAEVTKTANNLIYITRPEQVDAKIVEQKLAALKSMVEKNDPDNAKIISLIRSSNI